MSPGLSCLAKAWLSITCSQKFEASSACHCFVGVIMLDPTALRLRAALACLGGVQRYRCWVVESLMLTTSRNGKSTQLHLQRFDCGQNAMNVYGKPSVYLSGSFLPYAHLAKYWKALPGSYCGQLRWRLFFLTLSTTSPHPHHRRFAKVYDKLKVFLLRYACPKYNNL